MTRYKIFLDGGVPCGFVIEGHSGRAPQGSDIVCAAVSSAAYMVINTVTDILGVPAEVSETDARLSIRVAPGGTAACAHLFEGLDMHLRSLAEQYPENIARDE